MWSPSMGESSGKYITQTLSPRLETSIIWIIVRVDWHYFHGGLRVPRVPYKDHPPISGLIFTVIDHHQPQVQAQVYLWGEGGTLRIPMVSY
jgi:hypothetical protein